MFLYKRNKLALNISDAICESLFSKTELFKNEIIINFIQSLCTISKIELENFYIPRVFSLNKLIVLMHFNIFRNQFYIRSIWITISNYLKEIIIKNSKENIWKQALDSLKQIVIILLQKEEQLNRDYKFQEEVFSIFENILDEVNKISIKEENIIDIINFIITQYGKNINWGWINIFNLITKALKINNKKIYDNIGNILKYVYDYSNNIFINNNIELFEKFIQILCLIYNEKSMKQFSFEALIGILNKIIDNEKIIMKMPNSNKIFDFIKIFFYKLDNLMKINLLEYLNLLYEIISHNKKILLSKDLNIFIYIYILYFKANISIFILSKYENRLSLLNLKKEEKGDIYSFLSKDNQIEIIKIYLKEYINTLINNFQIKEGQEYEQIFYEQNNDDDKNKLCGFLKEIKNEIKISDGIFEKYVKNKIEETKNLEENNYELIIKYFLEKFKSVFILQNQEKEYIKYNYFYADLLLTIQELSILNSNTDLIYKVLFKIISSSLEEISESNKNKLLTNLNKILKIICLSKINSINEKDLFKFIKYSLDFFNYFLDFIQLFSFDFNESFKCISKLFNNILLLDIENKNNFEKYKIINSSSTIVLLMKLQDIQLFIIKKTKKENLKKIKNEEKDNTIIYLNKIYDKYSIDKDEKVLINKIIIFELENILPIFIDLLNKEKLEEVYQCLINLIGSINHNLRQGAKNILKSLINNKFIILNNKIK